MASPSLPARATPPTARSSMMCSRQEMYEPSAACARVGVDAMVGPPSPDWAKARSPGAMAISASAPAMPATRRIHRALNRACMTVLLDPTARLPPA